MIKISRVARNDIYVSYFLDATLAQAGKSTNPLPGERELVETPPQADGVLKTIVENRFLNKRDGNKKGGKNGTSRHGILCALKFSNAE
jgi:hypothetical protein